MTHVYLSDTREYKSEMYCINVGMLGKLLESIKAIDVLPNSVQFYKSMRSKSHH